MMILAVLDTNVIWGQLTRDLLLTLAELEYYEAILSSRIIDALQRHGVPKRAERLIKSGMTLEDAAQQATREVENIINQLKMHFQDQIYDNYQEKLIFCENDEGDRHVLALAIANEATHIVTENLRDFPERALSPHGVMAINLDTFLSRSFSAEQLLDALQTMSQRYKNPPQAVAELIEQLERTQRVSTAALLRG